jgi:hypothetical protein
VKDEKDVKYLSAKWGYHTYSNLACLSLGKKDLQPTRKIFQKYKIAPESLKIVSADCMLQKERLARFIIKELDCLLEVGGVFEITLINSRAHSSYFASIDQVMYELSISTNNRYRLVDKQTASPKLLKLTYEKIKKTLPCDDSMDKWSFGIITDGKNRDQVSDLIKSIERLGIPEYEIIICGPVNGMHAHSDQRIIELDDISLGNDLRAPTPAKKNKIIKSARYNNICVLHDRFYFSENWYNNFCKYGNYYDFLCMPTLDISGNRFQVDWMHFCYPITSTSRRNFSLSYDDWNKDVIIQGGVIVGKKNLLSEFMFDEKLHWGELEDMQLSKQAYLAGAFISVDPNNCIYSHAIRHIPNSYFPVINRFLENYSWFRGYLKNFFIFIIVTKFSFLFHKD